MRPIAILKPVVFVTALLPAAALAFGAYTGDLTANPGDYITDQTGTWTLAFLVISLTVTPLRRLTRWNDLIKLRRMLGLFSFFYATLHFATWAVLFNLLDPTLMLEDVIERPFITVGMATFLILTALALTSNRAAIRALGRRWQRLHRLAYVAAIGGVVHYWWLVKADVSEPRLWAIAVAVLLGLRFWWSWSKRTSAAARLSQPLTPR